MISTKTYTFVNALPVVEILPSAMLVARVITLDSLHTRLRNTQKKKKKRLVSDLNNTKPMSRSNLLIYLQKISISQSGHLIFEKWLHTFWIARLLEVLLWINNFIVSPEMITKRKKKS